MASPLTETPTLDTALAPITVGWDGRDGGFDALVLAGLVARPLEADVAVVHVETGEGFGRDLAADVELAFRHSGSTPRVHSIRDRAPAQALRAAAGPRPDDLLVLGSTHRAGVGRVLPGALAEQLLGRVPFSLALAPRDYAVRETDGKVRVVAAGFDGSPASVAALEFATRIALAAEATVRVIAVGSPTPVDLRGTPATRTAGVATAPDLRDRLTEAVSDIPAELRALPIFERGDAARVLLGHAEEGVDLLLIGSTGHRRLSSALVGGTARTVLRSAPCPVVVLPAG